MTKNNSNSLAIIERSGTEVALPVDLVQDARRFAENARSRGTQVFYGKLWRYFCDWCREGGMDPLSPDGVPTKDIPLQKTPEYVQLAQTVGLYITHLATRGGKRGAPMAISTIGSTIAAIKYHRGKHGLQSDALADPRFKEVLKGINRQIGSKRTVRKVNPFTREQLIDLLHTLDPNHPLDARDAAILALGFGCARRRSEIVFLDYEAMGEYADDDDKKARGYLTVDPKGVHVRLLVSKTNQDGTQEEYYVIPRNDAPRLCAAVENWVRVAGIKRGTPLFRYVKNVGGAGSRGTKKRSGYFGVSWRTQSETWQAATRKDGKTIYAGSAFKDPREAHIALCGKLGIEPQPGPYALDAITDRRLSDGGAVARIVKGRLAQWIRTQPGGKRMKPEEVKAFAREFSGHSLRAGHVTDAAERGIHLHHIQAGSGHRDAKMVMHYMRVVDKVKNSSLKGSGL